MVNCNPETVSTDYDTSDRLYFEPLTFEDVLEVVASEQRSAAAGGGEVAGVIVQLGGQTPLGLAQRLKDAGVPIVGTSPEAIHLAEERGAFGQVLAQAGLVAPKHGTARSYDEARTIAHAIGYPVLVRPSYVLGGRGMEIVYDDDHLAGYIDRATEVSPEHPVLVDRFLDDAIEVDVDALYDGEELFLGGVMEHIEEAGIHSGDSACALPPITLGRADIARIREATEGIARGVGVRGLLNVQFALAGDSLYVLEANPRASRTVPFVSKATDVALAKAAARVMLGTSIAELRREGLLPAGDGEVLRRNGVLATVVRKHSDGPGADGEMTIVDRIGAGEVDLIVNTPFGNTGPRLDGYEIRTAAVLRGVPCLTTVQALAAAVQGIEALRGGEIGVASLQEHHQVIRDRKSTRLNSSHQHTPYDV